MKQKIKDALKSMPDGCDIHNLEDWVFESKDITRRALLIAYKLMQEPSDSMKLAALDRDTFEDVHMDTFKAMRDQLLKEVDDEKEGKASC